VIEVRQTEIFARWLASARWSSAGPHQRPNSSTFGRQSPVGGGVSEMRIDYGPGYRVYFVRRGEALVILVAGGDKRTQSHDIAMAIKLARDL
jgi:putative addiction module killer protein